MNWTTKLQSDELNYLIEKGDDLSDKKRAKKMLNEKANNDALNSFNEDKLMRIAVEEEKQMRLENEKHQEQKMLFPSQN
jgi:hypothetical protein